MKRQLRLAILGSFFARSALVVLAAFIGWMLGALVYVGLLYVTGNPPESGDIHVGVLPLGLIGLIIAVRSTLRWIKRSKTTSRIET